MLATRFQGWVFGSKVYKTKPHCGQRKDGVRMAIIINEDDCTACGACAESCPVGAITVEDVAVVDDDECVECGACVDECPNGAISLP